jgi:hypothetical protein
MVLVFRSVRNWTFSILKCTESRDKLKKEFKSELFVCHWRLERWCRQWTRRSIDWRTASHVSDVGVHGRAHHRSRGHGQQRSFWGMWRLQFRASPFSLSLEAGTGKDIYHYQSYSWKLGSSVLIHLNNALCTIPYIIRWNRAFRNTYLWCMLLMSSTGAEKLRGLGLILTFKYVAVRVLLSLAELSFSSGQTDGEQSI